MINLKGTLKSHPNCLSSKALFKSVLMDIYPNEKRAINILAIMFESGIVQKIKSKSTLYESDFQALLMQFENDYGIIAKYSSECIRIWADALSVAIQVTNEIPLESVTYKPIIHKTITDTVVEGCKSDYETEVLKTGDLKITKFIGFDEKEITIPNQLDGKPITIIGENAFAKCTGIEKVTIPAGITTIGYGAFIECTGLNKVIISEGLTTIENGAFAECTSLENIFLPTTLKWLGCCVFQSTAIASINLPNGITNVPGGCFSGCLALKTIALPDNLSAIHSGAFRGSGLEQINIPPSCVEIENDAFTYCQQLKQVLLHEGLKKIGDRAFEDCKSLCSITIPNSVIEIGKQVFDITGWYQPYDRRRKGWSTREKNSELTISCYAGSYGLEYARSEGFKIKNAAK